MGVLANGGPSPRVSVIVPFLNPGAYLAEALDSIAAQSFTDWEVRLVDDGSTDDSARIADAFVRRYPDRASFQSHPGGVNRGTAASRNLAAAGARGQILAFLDADDVWLPHTVHDQIALLDRYPEADVVYGATEYWVSWDANRSDGAVDEVPDLGLEPERVFAPGTLSLVNYPLGTGPAPSRNTIAIRRGAFDRLGGFEESFTGIQRMYEDQAFLTKIYLHCHVVVAAVRWDRYRQHDRSMCAQVTAAGQYNDVRAHFLDWCAAHLAQHSLERPELIAAIARGRSGADEDPAAPSTSYRRRRVPKGHAPWPDAERAQIRDVLIGDRWHLHAADVHPLVGGGIKVRLCWDRAAGPLNDHFVAIHLVDDAGGILAQADYPMDQGVGDGPAGERWCDVRVFDADRMKGVSGVAIGVYDSTGTLAIASSGPSDWDGRRLLLSITPRRP
jgi:hypothetical protein